MNVAVVKRWISTEPDLEKDFLAPKTHTALGSKSEAAPRGNFEEPTIFDGPPRPPEASQTAQPAPTSALACPAGPTPAARIGLTSGLSRASTRTTRKMLIARANPGAMLHIINPLGLLRYRPKRCLPDGNTPRSDRVPDLREPP